MKSTAKIFSLLVFLLLSACSAVQSTPDIEATRANLQKIRLQKTMPDKGAS